MLARLCLILCASLWLVTPLAAQSGTGQAVTLVDQSGNPIGTGSNPLVSSSGNAAGSGGLSTFSRIPSSAASTNLTTAKASAGRAYTFNGCNTTSSTIYLRLYNAASTAAVTVGTTVPFAGAYAFPANTCIPPTMFADGVGIYASVGITYAFGTTPLDTDTTTIGAGAISAFQIGYQ